MCSGDPYAPGSVVLNPLTGNPLGPTDQRSQIRTFNIAPTWTRVLNPNTVLTIGAWVRHDQYNYYPSPDLFSDLGPLQDETFSQFRTLTNAGIRSDVTYVKGIHNIKVGGTFQHTFLTENDTFGIVNPGLLAGCTSDACVTLAAIRPDEPSDGPKSGRIPLSRPHGHQGGSTLRAGHHHQGALVHHDRDPRRFL